MSRTPIIAGICVCALGVAIGIFAPLDQINRLWYQRDNTPLVLPAGELPRKEAVIALLQDQRYDELEKIYGLTLAADQRSATDALNRFNAFAYADPGLQEFLDGWIVEHKSSPLPSIARGQYYLHLAYTVRGEKFRAETSANQFEEMRRFLELAGKDFQRAIEIGPPSVAAYEGLIDVAITGGKRSKAGATLDRALAATDNPLPLHISFMRALEPQWGGSHGAPSAYWDSLRRGGTLRRSDQHLDFVGIILIAEEACSINDCENAVESYEEALDLQPKYKGILGHARALASLERYEEALEVLDTGLQRNPDLPGHHELKAIILWAAAGRDETFAAIREALKLNPYDPDLLMTSKEISDDLEKDKQQSGDASGAEFYRQQSDRDVEMAMVYGALRSDVQLAWARTVLGNGGPREQAYAAFKEAIRLAPKEPEYVLAYGNALAAVKDCNALQVYRNFEKMCKRGGYCSQYVSVDVLTGWLEEQCENPEKVRRKRMLPSTLEQMETCKADYKAVSAERALARCTEKAESGDAAAAFDLGVIYAAGYGVDIDNSSAVRWLEAAADNGHLKALGTLGHFVYQGIGTEKDAERGLRLIREAAERGDIAAMFALGFIYYDGRNDNRDLQESFRWFSQAAELGSEEARSALHRFFGDELGAQ